MNKLQCQVATKSRKSWDNKNKKWLKWQKQLKSFLQKLVEHLQVHKLEVTDVNLKETP